jgi:hypothetical protein
MIKLFYQKKNKHKIMLLRFIQLLVLFLALISFTINCSVRKNLISEGELARITLETSKLFADDSSMVRFEIKPKYPITIDSILTGKIGILWRGSFEDFVKRTNNKLNNKTFWKIKCWQADHIDGEYEIYIDTQTGEVLHIDGMGASRFWPPEPEKE